MIDKDIEEIMKKYEKLLKENDLDLSDRTTEDLEELLGFNVDEFSEQLESMFNTHDLFVKKLHEDAIIPSYNYETDSGFDLYSVESVLIEPLGRVSIPTGISVSFPENLELQIRPKSGLALNLGLTVLNTPGTIDQGYTGEIKVIVFNTNDKSIKIDKGTKIAQGVLCPVMSGKYVRITETETLPDKDRGINGFGSTGIK